MPDIIGLVEKFAQVFYKMLQESPNELFGQPNISGFGSVILTCISLMSLVRDINK